MTNGVREVIHFLEVGRVTFPVDIVHPNNSHYSRCSLQIPHSTHSSDLSITQPKKVVFSVPEELYWTIVRAGPAHSNIQDSDIVDSIDGREVEDASVVLFKHRVVEWKASYEHDQDGVGTVAR